MFSCSGEITTIMSILKTIFKLAGIVLPVILIVMLTWDLMRMVVTNKEDDIKKNKKSILTRVVACVCVYLVPTFVFLVFGVIFNNSFGIKDLSSCWYNTENNIALSDTNK